MLLGRFLRRRLVRVSIETEVLRRVLRRGGVFCPHPSPRASEFLTCDFACSVGGDERQGWCAWEHRVGFSLVLLALRLFRSLGAEIHHLSFSTLQKHYVLKGGMSSFP